MDVSQISQIVDTQARGKQEFKETFSKLCLSNYEQFEQTVHWVFDRGDIARLKGSIHKIQTLNKLFECHDFQMYLSELSQNPDRFFGNEEALGRISKYCALITTELNSIG